MKTKVNKPDHDYRDAVNYDGTNYFNPPMSITINGKTYILPCGEADHLTIEPNRTKDCIIIINENPGLSYIGMTEINYINNNVTSVFLNEQDTTGDPDTLSYGILDKGTAEQITILYEYFPY